MLSATPLPTHEPDLRRRIEADLAAARARLSSMEVRVAYGDKLAERCLPAIQKTVDQLTNQLDDLEQAA